MINFEIYLKCIYVIFNFYFYIKKNPRVGLLENFPSISSREIQKSQNIDTGKFIEKYLLIKNYKTSLIDEVYLDEMTLELKLLHNATSKYEKYAPLFSMMLTIWMRVKLVYLIVFIAKYFFIISASFSGYICLDNMFYHINSIVAHTVGKNSERKS